MMQIWNMSGGLLYLVAPPKTKWRGRGHGEVVVPAAYYKFEPHQTQTMSGPHVIGSDNQQAYSSLMQGLQELDLRGNSTPGSLYLLGEHAFPLAMNTQGQVLMAASLFGRGCMVVLGHESYLTTFPALVENALVWLRGHGSENLGKAVADNLVCWGSLAQTRGWACTWWTPTPGLGLWPRVWVFGPDPGVGVYVVGVYVVDAHPRVWVFGPDPGVGVYVVDAHPRVWVFGPDPGVGVYVVDAYSVAPDVKSLVEFLKGGGGLLMAGQAWSWTEQNPKKNTLQAFPGNKVSSVAGIYFSEHQSEAECLSGFHSLPLDSISLLFLHRTWFRCGTTPCAGWTRAGRAVGIHPSMSHLPSLYGPSGLSCHNLDLPSDLSVSTASWDHDLSVSTASWDQHAQEMQDFVMEGGGLLLAEHAWYWRYCYPELNLLTDFAGNRILSKMGLNVLGATVSQGFYDPDPDPTPTGPSWTTTTSTTLCPASPDTPSTASRSRPERRAS
ncbi:hypothetical protein NHX12_008453 [Muraenolepis orangiensis]|uniref:Uncharacterized protein n=1 Tax=Muraenolepis orangiensis TaxID=630683 RepID=A0A9Q0I832_9TELE|nr:hypothetical protein NHX12_008453 [Muraenolepis orangiensis]